MEEEDCRRWRRNGRCGGIGVVDDDEAIEEESDDDDGEEDLEALKKKFINKGNAKGASKNN
jgi:hypothetical protein